jgi:protoporphyrinogen oxidase
MFDPYLKKINPDYAKTIIDYKLFKNPFAQPIVSVNYSKIIPKTTTPLKNVFLADMQQVYPWDRGTNYAVQLGQKVAREIFTDD